MKRPPPGARVSREEITSWIRCYRGSSLGLRPFAEKNKLSINRLRYWVYGKRNSKSVKPSAAAPVFQEMKLTGGLPLQSWAAEVSLPNGLAVRFSAESIQSSPEFIVQVIHQLSRP
jgi:hypothetical protein